MTQIAHNKTTPPNNSIMTFKVNKKGKILKTTIKIKDTTLKADVDIIFLGLAAIMISLINIIYLIGVF